jgi:long-chain-fatty-acid--[acyl-carrier-protein] ligase
MGVVTYRRLKVMVIAMARLLRRRVKEREVGILLPSSVGANLLVLATLLAGKVPVMLNWTVGVRSLNHCLKLTGVRTVLSSRRFLNNLNNGDLGEVDDLIVLLEDLREEMTLVDKIAGFWALLKDAQGCVKEFGLEGKLDDDPAVILFTSGTESLPKAVPLSHRNILTNQGAALSCIQLTGRDILYAVLPPFHSFGFSVTGMLPLLAGVKVYYAPDPTDHAAMVHDIATWRPTIFCCAPTFIQGLFRAAHGHHLASLRYVVSGAERTPRELFDAVAAMGEGHELLEGYGITECGPIVTLTRSKMPRVGVGLPIPGVELCIIDPETSEVLGAGIDGEICIRGPNVFHGYIGHPRTPFVTLKGVQWYRSGDRGHLEEGALVLTGRLKRFVKIGGEMVGLGGIEDELLKLAAEQGWAKSSPEQEEGPILAIAVREVEGEKPVIVLFTTFQISKEAANEALKASGFGKIVKIGEVKQIEKIPLTGVGKVHYSGLVDLL